MGIENPKSAKIKYCIEQSGETDIRADGDMVLFDSWEEADEYCHDYSKGQYEDIDFDQEGKTPEQISDEIYKTLKIKFYDPDDDDGVEM